MLDDIIRYLQSIWDNEKLQSAGRQVVLNAVRGMGHTAWDYANDHWVDIAKAIRNWFS
jgi:hypothetical protein